MITKAKQDFCAHGFTMGFCPNSCLKSYYHTEAAQQKRKEFLSRFKKRDWKNPITRETLILKLQQFHKEEQYVQMPINIITFGKHQWQERPKEMIIKTQ